MRKNVKALLAGAMLAGVFVANAGAAEVTLDLATTSPQDAKNGAVFYRTQIQPTGTGVIDPFVRIQNKGTEHGYNTDGVSEFDTKDTAVHNWTHSITINDVPVVNIGGILYREFILDINETNNQAGRMLSMNELQIYQSNSNVLSSFNTGTQTFGSPAAHSTSLIYDLDSVGTDAVGDKVLKMDYSLASGSGSGDMFAYIRNDLFITNGSKNFVYLYSKFGTPDKSDAGFEEWAVREGATPIPLPSAAWMGLAGLGLIGAAKFRKHLRRGA